MNRWVFAATLLLLPSLPLHAEDGDKNILYSTFYLDGEKASYVLIMTPDKKFEIFGPDNERIEGTVRASGEHVTLIAGNMKRLFHYDSAGKDIKLGRREGDTPQKGNLLGELPPTADGVFRTIYICEANWTKKGRPAFKRDGTQKLSQPATPEKNIDPAPPAVVAPLAEPAPAVVATPVEPATALIGNCADLAGTYTVKNVGANDDVLVIQLEGQFSYARADGMKQAGTLLRADTDLTFMGGGLKRQFSLKTTHSGLELTRRDTDVVKPGEVLGSMPPQDRAALTWLRKSAAPAPEVKPAPAAATQEPAPTATRPSPAPVVPESKPAPEVRPAAPAAAGAAITGLKQLAGSFTHKPSPFISETIAVAEDGNFSYKDSNGASVNGTVKVENNVVTFTSGEVVRTFTAKLEGNVLVLTRTENDNPKFKNDLASMSPTVLKEAKYEKK